MLDAVNWDIVLLIVTAFVKALVIILVLLGAFAYMTLMERRTLGRIQARIGPNRVGPLGLFQPLADGLKLMTKEDVTPSQANRWIHNLAPIGALVPALIIFAVIPIGPTIPLNDRTSWTWYVANINVGYLYATAIASLGVYGIVLAGWGSNSKYSLLGGLRAAAQMISYELAQGLAALTVVLMAGTLSLYEIVQQQNLTGLPYAIYPPFIVGGTIAFLIYLVAGVAEANRAPFDLPEAESELGGGFHTEYSGLKWAMFFMAEYINMVNISALATVLFLGGWWPAGLLAPWVGPVVAGLLGPIFFVLKLVLFIFLYMWLRGTLPRLRFDRLMNLGWKVLFPVALANLVLTAVIVALWPAGAWPFS